MKQTFSTEDWDRRFRIQSRWSREIRQTCRVNFPLPPFSKILEVGCGTGAVLSDFSSIPGGLVTGIDLSFERLGFLKKNDPVISLLAANGYQLPFKDRSFDQVFCHYLLLWLKRPLLAIQEIKRVLIPGGMFFIFSEPDYGGRIDFPTELNVINEMQKASLVDQGADPFIGRRIPALLQEAGFRSIKSGIIPWSSANIDNLEEFKSEWEMIEKDNARRISKEHLTKLKAQDKAARESGIRVEYIPVFYAWGST